MLTDPDSVASPHLRTWWWRDRTLTEWIKDIKAVQNDASDNALARAVFGPTYAADVTTLFYANQCRRWLARKVLLRFRTRIWSRKPACNMDLIDMAPVSDRDAISIMDTTNHRIFRFHRRDLLNTVMSNLTMSDEFLPSPRHPTNPWTNEPFTRAQTMAVCHRLCADFVARGRCPPALLSSFWASNFSVKRFQRENSAVLSQYAIRNYFRDITDDNFHTVFDTMTGLLSDAGCSYSPMAVRTWLKATPLTPTHQEWLALCRDYTLYMNLHIQARPTWYDVAYVYRDVRLLFGRTELPTPSLRVIRNTTAAAGSRPPAPTAGILQPLLPLLTMPTVPPVPTIANIGPFPTELPTLETTGAQGLLCLMFRAPATITESVLLPGFGSGIDLGLGSSGVDANPLLTDVSGGSGTMSMELALQLIRDSLFRL